MVTDFGVAKAATDAPRAMRRSIALGTPAYMAPEQIDGDPAIDHRADIYSVGVLGVRAAGGTTAIRRRPRQRSSAHLTRTPTPLTTYRPDVPAPLAELVMKCLEKQPDDRWQSADEMRAATRRLASRGPAIRDAPRSAPVAIEGRGCRRDCLLLRSACREAKRLRGGVVANSVGQRAHRAAHGFSRLRGGRRDLARRPARGVPRRSRQRVRCVRHAQSGSGQFVNLTGGSFPQLFNEDVRNIGFTRRRRARMDPRRGHHVAGERVHHTHVGWGRRAPFLNKAVMAVWSPDGSKVGVSRDHAW